MAADFRRNRSGERDDTSSPVLITGARESYKDELKARKRRYFILMSVRIPALLLAAAALAGCGRPDTSRNGQADTRTRWGNWCNIKGAGLGPRPEVAPVQGVDAYFWIKPPGDSDGTADPNAARFDENCASPDATPGAPEAGQWFHSYFVELVQRANPPL